MKNLPKMTFEECTTPVSQICCIPSQLEAEAIAAVDRVKHKQMKLAHIITSFDEHQICWCAMHNKQEINQVYPVFRDNCSTKGLPLLAKFIDSEDYIFYNGHFFTGQHNDSYKLLIREINVFSTYYDALAASYLFAHQHTPQEQEQDEDVPEIYVARITTVDNPHNVLCVCWFIYRRNAPPFFPIFIEDMQIFYNTDYRTLNWEFLGEGDVFKHDNDYYKVCIDENNQLYIAKLFKCNMQILSKK